MTAGDVVERIKKNLGVPWNERTYRDTFKVGGPETEVKGIATTFMATLDLLRRAHAAGMNFVITHEPTFWNDADTVKDFAEDPVYRFKLDFCNKNNMAVWRFHDHAHAHRPDFIWVGLARALGWQEHEAPANQRRFILPPITLRELAADVKRHMNIRAIRVAGNPDLKVSTVAVGMGYNIPRITADVDVVMGGENPETVPDSNKGVIILGHAISEEPGMEDCANWLRTFVTEVPIQFIRAGEPFWS